MGLDVKLLVEKYGFRAGGYGWFARFREALAESKGIRLHDMIGFGGHVRWDNDIPYCELLKHSDCEGELWWYNCERLAEDFTEENKQLLGIEFHDDYDNWWAIIIDCVQENGGDTVLLIDMKKASIIQILLPPNGLDRTTELRAKRLLDELETLFQDIRNAEVKVF